LRRHLHHEEKTSDVASRRYSPAAINSHRVISIAVSSQKGGVGKTTVSINLAHAFARAGVRTLLVDADPPANSTSGVGFDPRNVKTIIY
jgi:Mrp family chromosome partitioning ATPase